MHTTSKDLKLAHLYVVFLGTRRYRLNETMTAFPLRDLPEFTLPETP